MELLRGIRLFLTICGCWPPASWTSSLQRTLYKIYSIFVFLLIHTLVIAEILGLLLVDNQDDFNDNFYITVILTTICIKLCVLFLTEGNIRLIIQTLQEEPFVPQGIEEVEIQTKFHEITEWNTFAYTSLIGSSVLLTFAITFINSETRKLVYPTWLPYDYTSLLVFSLTNIYQMAAAIIMTLTTGACDSLFSGLMTHIYCQFEILGHRLQNVEGNRGVSMKQCARHHSEIYKLAAMVNEEFKVIMFMQFLTSTLTICFDLYQLMKTDLDSKLVDILMFTSCTFLQIYYYCWYGNEVKLKSLEVMDQLFASNWQSFSKSSAKILLISMRQALEPIEFTSGHIVSADLESFKALVKTSYSAFNLLQQSK